MSVSSADTARSMSRESSRLRSPPADALRAALTPAAIAIIGASDQPVKPGGRPIAFLRQYGFAGAIYPVNPGRDTVQGLKSLPSILDAPTKVDLAVIALPADGVLAAIRDCATAGVSAVVVLSSGFREVGHAAGAAAEAEIRAMARAAGMRIIGPNTQGLADFRNGVVVNISSMFLQQPAADGPVGIVSQSGAMASVCYGHVRRMGIGVRYAHATGNEADVSALELAGALCEDPDLRLLLIYLETIASAEQLYELGSKARARGLPVLLLKAARTDAGQRAAMSHTGALANEDRIVDEVLRRAGICRVATFAEMVASVPLYLQSWRNGGGRRLAVISNSGATCVMAADAAAAGDMPLAAFSAATVQLCGDLLPSYATPTNPLDLTSTLMTRGQLFTELMPAIAADPGVDNILFGMTVAGESYDVEGFAQVAARTVTDAGKPLLIVASQPEVAAPFLARGLPVFADEAVAVSCIARLASHRRIVERAASRDDHGSPAPRVAACGPTLDEAASLRLLASAGVPVVPFRLCRTEAEAIAAFRELGGAVVVKGCSAAIPHKSEFGLVRIGIRDEAELRTSFAEIMRNLDARPEPCSGVIVARMLSARHEMMIGVHTDPVFGPILMVGDGGKFVEAMRDTAVLPLPVTPADVRDALAGLRIAPLLRGGRGDDALDVAAFCEAAVAVAELARTGQVVALDVNPVMLGKVGEGCVAVDAVATLPGQDSQEPKGSDRC